MSDLTIHSNTESFIGDIKRLMEQGRNAAYGAVNAVMIETYWRIGQRIVEQEQKGKERADYGTQLIELLSAELTRTYGKGFSKRNLQYFRSFYLTFNNLEIVQTRLHNLKWSHILTTLRVEDPVAARWYLQTASQEMWSVRTLDRNIRPETHRRRQPDHRHRALQRDQQGHCSLLDFARQRQPFCRQIHAADAHRGRTAPRDRATEGIV